MSTTTIDIRLEGRDAGIYQRSVGVAIDAPAEPMTALPDGVRGAAVFNVFEIGRCDFKHGQTPALNKVIAYSLQGAWSGPKPASENFPFKMTQRFFARLKNPRHQGGPVWAASPIISSRRVVPGGGPRV